MLLALMPVGETRRNSMSLSRLAGPSRLVDAPHQFVALGIRGRSSLRPRPEGDRIPNVTRRPRRSKNGETPQKNLVRRKGSRMGKF